MHPASDTSDVLPDLEDAMEELNQAAAQRKESGAAGSKYDIYQNYCCTFFGIFQMHFLCILMILTVINEYVFQKDAMFTI